MKNMTKNERIAKRQELADQLEELNRQEWASMNGFQKTIQCINVVILIVGYISMWYLTMAALFFGVAKAVQAIHELCPKFISFMKMKFHKTSLTDSEDVTNKFEHCGLGQVINGCKNTVNFEDMGDEFDTED